MKLVKLPLRAAKYAFLAIVVATLLISCSEESKLASHIPKDASGVLAFNVKSLAMKSLDFKEILTFDNLKKVFSTESDSISEAFRNSGIDYMNKAYIFGAAKGENKGYGAAIAALSDGKKFEAFLKKIHKDIEITQDGSFQTASIDLTTVVGWGDGVVILLFSDENPKADLLAVANLKSSESLAANSDTFKELEKEEADISAWVDFESFQKMVPQSPYSATAAGMDLKDTYMTGTCNFEDGQIVANGKYISNGELAKKFNFMKDNVNSELVGNLPGNSVIGLMGFAVDMGKLAAYLESEKLFEAYDPSATQFTGMTTKEILAMLSGDVGVTINGLAMKDVPTMDWNTGKMVTTKQPDIEYCAMLGIADKAKAEQLLNHFVEAGMLTKTDKVYAMQDKIFIIEKGNAYAITGAQSIKQALVDGTGEKLNGDLSGLFTSNASAFYLTPNGVSDAFYVANPFAQTHVTNLGIEDITVTSSAFKDNVSTSKFVIRFKEKGENSLITLSKISKKYSTMYATMSAPPPIEVTGEEEAVEEEASETAGQ